MHSATKKKGTKAERAAIAHHISDLRTSVGLCDKLLEYRNRPQHAQSLLAELEMASALRTATGLEVMFQVNDNADLRLVGDGIDWTVEVARKSSPSPFARVFYPAPDVLATYAQSPEAKLKDWERAALRLHRVVASLPIRVGSWLEPPLMEPAWSGPARCAQEKLCAEVAAWLTDKLLGLKPPHEATLRHHHARFEVRATSQAPGYFGGSGPLAAFLLHLHPGQKEGKSMSCWLRQTILEKATKSKNRGGLHFVGLVVDEPFASPGYFLKNLFLGGEVSSSTERRSFRPVPAQGVRMIEAARAAGRGDLLDRMLYDGAERPRPMRIPLGQDDSLLPDGLVFERAISPPGAFNQTALGVDGVLALYCTGKLQFLPNPFSPRQIENSQGFLPWDLELFDPRAQVKRSEVAGA